MTNTTEEMSGGEEGTMMPPTSTIGASVEAPPMQGDVGHNDDDDVTQQECIEDDRSTEQELVIAVGNAAKAYRHHPRYRLPKEPDTDIRSTTTTSTATATSGDMNDGDVGGGDDDDDGNTTKSGAGMNENNDIVTTIASTTSALGGDYVGKGCEEEYGSYKTSTLADQTQSELFIQQSREELAKLISTLGLFLAKTWNWLQYTFVTIIFLNLVHFGRRGRQRLCGDTVLIGEGRSVDVDVDGATEEEVEESESGNIIEREGNQSSEGSLESNKDEEVIMSPNTCSIQNTQQEVETAEEAIIATEVTVEKSGIAQVIITPPEDVSPALDEEVEETAPIAESQQKRQITIILPEDDESDESEDNVDGLRRDSVDSCVSSEGSGNLGDTEDGSGEKSEENSNDGDSNSDVTSNSGEESAKDVAQKIISQVESMFSDEHLAKDGFLLKHVRRRSDGFVSLKLVAGLRKVKQISREFPTVLDALKDSAKLEINNEGTKVRRVEPLTQFLKAVPIKSKDQKPGKDKETGSSNEETQQTAQQNNKSKVSKENDNGNKQNAQNRRHSAHVQNNANPNNGNQNRRNSSAQNNQSHHNNRKSSNTSTSSNNSSRHNSFSKAPGTGSQHPADLFRNVYTSTMMAAYSSSGEESQSPQVGRRRGGSLPITALQRSSGTHLSPNSSPPNGSFVMIGPNGGARPKSNSYCEGTNPTTMSPWLQRRKASASSRLSSGELVLNGVVRQPRGPDGTKGFADGYRAMIIQERLSHQSNSAVSA